MSTLRSTGRIALALAAGLSFGGIAFASPAPSPAQMQAHPQHGLFSPSPNLVREINQAYGTQFRVRGGSDLFVYSSAIVPSLNANCGAMGNSASVPTVSSAQPSHEASDNGPPTFTPWLNINNGQ